MQRATRCPVLRHAVPLNGDARVRVLGVLAVPHRRQKSSRLNHGDWTLPCRSHLAAGGRRL